MGLTILLNRSIIQDIIASKYDEIDEREISAFISESVSFMYSFLLLVGQLDLEILHKAAWWSSSLQLHAKAGSKTHIPLQ